MKLAKTSKRGTLILHGVKLESHELDTIMFLLRMLKCCIEIIPPSSTPKRKSGDFYLDGLLWEAKSPVKNEMHAIERLFHEAGDQASNLVFDLRRLKGSDVRAIARLEKCFNASRRIRRMMVITKVENLSTYKK